MAKKIEMPNGDQRELVINTQANPSATEIKQEEKIMSMDLPEGLLEL